MNARVGFAQPEFFNLLARRFRHPDDSDALAPFSVAGARMAARPDGGRVGVVPGGADPNVKAMPRAVGITHAAIMVLAAG